jgi:hypothetical protein
VLILSNSALFQTQNIVMIWDWLWLIVWQHWQLHF